MLLEGRYQASIYIQVTYMAHAAHSMSKVSKVSIISHMGYVVTRGTSLPRNYGIYWWFP